MIHLIRIVICLSICTSVLISEQSTLKIGQEAPSIYLFKLESNKYFKSKELLGKKNLVVSFFATWCVPCAKEIPELTKLSKQFGDEFQFLLIDVNEKRDKVKEHVLNKGISLPVVLDKYGKTFEKFGGKTLPLLVVVNKDGLVSYHHTGYKDGDELLLKEHLESL